MALEHFEDGDVLYASDLNEIVDELSTTTTDLRSYLASGLSATTFQARRYGNTVEIYGSISGSFSSQTNTAVSLSSSIPSSLRPDHSAIGTAYLFVSGGGFGSGILQVRDTGELRLFYLSGTTRTSVTFSVTYVLTS